MAAFVLLPPQHSRTISYIHHLSIRDESRCNYHTQRFQTACPRQSTTQTAGALNVATPTRSTTTPAAAPRKNKDACRNSTPRKNQASAAPETTAGLLVRRLRPVGRRPRRGPADAVEDGRVHLQRRPDFKPNLSPKEVLQAGSFGGGYFRDITSSVTKTTYKDTGRSCPRTGSRVWM